MTITVDPATATNFSLRLRIPGWCTASTVSVNATAVDIAANNVNGYLQLTREWVAGDVVTMDLPMPVQRVRAHPHVIHDIGCVALQRGPLIFCVEQVDNGDQLGLLRLPKSAELKPRFAADLLGGTVILEGPAERLQPANDELYSRDEPGVIPAKIKAIPYSLWNNRGEGEMRVWIRES